MTAWPLYTQTWVSNRLWRLSGSVPGGCGLGQVFVGLFFKSEIKAHIDYKVSRQRYLTSKL